jgi:hypothetical protein
MTDAHLHLSLGPKGLVRRVPGPSSKQPVRNRIHPSILVGAAAVEQFDA